MVRHLSAQCGASDETWSGQSGAVRLVRVFAGKKIQSSCARRFGFVQGNLAKGGDPT